MSLSSPLSSAICEREMKSMLLRCNNRSIDSFHSNNGNSSMTPRSHTHIGTRGRLFQSQFTALQQRLVVNVWVTLPSSINFCDCLFHALQVNVLVIIKQIKTTISCCNKSTDTHAIKCKDSTNIESCHLSFLHKQKLEIISVQIEDIDSYSLHEPLKFCNKSKISFISRNSGVAKFEIFVKFIIFD